MPTNPRVEGEDTTRTEEDLSPEPESREVVLGADPTEEAGLSTEADTIPLEAGGQSDLSVRIPDQEKVSTATLFATPAGVGIITGAPDLVAETRARGLVMGGGRPRSSSGRRQRILARSGSRSRSQEGRPPRPRVSTRVGYSYAPCGKATVVRDEGPGGPTRTSPPHFDASPDGRGPADRPDREGGAARKGSPPRREAMAEEREGDSEWETMSETTLRMDSPEPRQRTRRARGGHGDDSDGSDDSRLPRRRRLPGSPKVPRSGKWPTAAFPGDGPDQTAPLTPEAYRQLFDEQYGGKGGPSSQRTEETKLKVKQRKYTGVTDWTDFRLQFETNARANGWKGQDLFYQLVASLEDDALAVYGDNPGAASYEALCEKLTERFSSKNSQLLDQHLFDGLQFDGTKQTPEAYGAQVQRLARRAFGREYDTLPYLQTLLISRFVGGLKNDVAAQWVYCSNPQSLQDAVTAFACYWSQYGPKVRPKKPAASAGVHLVQASERLIGEAGVAVVAPGGPQSRGSPQVPDAVDANFQQHKRAMQSMFDKHRAEVQGLLQQCSQLVKAGNGAVPGGTPTGYAATGFDQAAGAGGRPVRKMKCHYCHKDGTHSWRVCRKLRDDVAAGITPSTWKPNLGQKQITYPPQEGTTQVKGPAPPPGVNMVGQGDLNPNAEVWSFGSSDPEGSSSEENSGEQPTLNGEGQ